LTYNRKYDILNKVKEIFFIFIQHYAFFNKESEYYKKEIFIMAKILTIIKSKKGYKNLGLINQENVPKVNENITINKKFYKIIDVAWVLDKNHEIEILLEEL
jgi:hypothetical protein